MSVVEMKNEDEKEYLKGQLEEMEKVDEGKVEMRKAIILDLDSTVINIDHRLHWILGEKGKGKGKGSEGLAWKKNWVMFRDMSEMMKDKLIVPVFDVVVGMYARGYEILVITGRSDESRLVTEWQLKNFEIPYEKLFMRRRGDRRRSEKLKSEIFEREVKGVWDVQLVLDDHPEVVEMFRGKGLNVMHVRTSIFEF